MEKEVWVLLYDHWDVPEEGVAKRARECNTPYDKYSNWGRNRMVEYGDGVYVDLGF